MTAGDFEEFVRGLGHTVETVTGMDNNVYTVIRDYEIRAGSLAGTICDVANSAWRATR